jgi:hypothetical protein
LNGFLIGGHALAPLTLNSVKRQQMGDWCWPRLYLIDVHHLKPITTPWVVIRSMSRPKGCAQSQATNSTHSIDTNTHKKHSKTD